MQHSFKRDLLLIVSFISIFNCGKLPAAAEDHPAGQPQSAQDIPDKVFINPPGQFIPDIPVFDAENNKIYFDQYEGKTLLLVFWATWCNSCVSEMSSLDNLKKDFRKLPLEILAISQDFQGVPAIRTFFAKQEIRHLAILHDYQNKLMRSMAVSGLPVAFLVNYDGEIKLTFKGAIKWNEEKVRAIILEQIPGNFKMPKNSYKENLLNIHK